MVTSNSPEQHASIEHPVSAIAIQAACSNNNLTVLFGILRIPETITSVSGMKCPKQPI